MIGLVALLACQGPMDPLVFLDSGDSDPTAIDSSDTASMVETGDSSGSTITDTEPPVPLELCVNEFMPDNQAALVLDDDTTPDWLELHNPGETDVHLAGWSLTDDSEEQDKHAIHSSLWLEAGGFLVFYADDATDLGPEHLSFRLGSEGGTVGLFAPDGRGQLVRHGAVDADFSVHRVPDCCTGEDCLGFDFRGTPGTTNDPPVPVEQTLLSLEDTWRYYDTGDPPLTEWKRPDFDDSSWAEGVAPLGAGDSHITTTIDIGPEGDRRPTLYFRHTFEVEDPEKVHSLTLQLVVDDAALIWLNETDVVRSNFVEGQEVNSSTWAASAIGDTAEYLPVGWSIDPSVLVAGTNILAVEVHQHAPTSSDLTFDLGVVVEVLE